MGNTHTRVQPSETKGNTCAKGHDASSTKIQETLHDMLKSDETLTSSQIIAHLNANVTKNQIFHKEDCFLKNMDRITSDTIQVTSHRGVVTTRIPIIESMQAKILFYN